VELSVSTPSSAFMACRGLLRMKVHKLNESLKYLVYGTWYLETGRETYSVPMFRISVTFRSALHILASL
jgi:membrane protein CcdC involved in cytochrome C biogenesis